MIKLKEYKVKAGYYSGIIESIIKLPVGLKLITGGQKDIYKFKYDGLLHYIGCIKNDNTFDVESLNQDKVTPYKFGEYIIITVQNVLFIDEEPDIISQDEFNELFDLSKYRILDWSKDLNLKNIITIKRINSISNIECSQITLKSTFDNIEALSISKQTYDIEDTLCPNFYDFIAISDSEIAQDYWNTALNIVLEAFGEQFNTDDNKLVDLNEPKRLFENGDYDEINEYLNLNKVKYC